MRLLVFTEPLASEARTAVRGGTVSLPRARRGLVRASLAKNCRLLSSRIPAEPVFGGTGWYDDEHHAYGIPFRPLGERFERLEEQLAIVTGLWSNRSRCNRRTRPWSWAAGRDPAGIGLSAALVL